MSKPELTWCINAFNTSNYLKLAVESIRKNGYYKDAPIIVYSENNHPGEGTNEWLATQPDIKSIIEFNEEPKGIGGGGNEAISRVETEFFSLIHTDMYIAKDYDKVLLDLCKSMGEKSVVSSWRLEPNIYQQSSRLGTTMSPLKKEDGGFGLYWNEFDSVYFEQFANQFILDNNIQFRKIEGCQYVMRKKDWDYIGGNDSKSFRQAFMEDYCLHTRMVLEDFKFCVTSKALVYHFGSRSSTWLNDDISKFSDRKKWESINYKAFIDKWGEPPLFDEVGFTKVSPQMRERYFKHIKGKY